MGLHKCCDLKYFAQFGSLPLRKDIVEQQKIWKMATGLIRGLEQLPCDEKFTTFGCFLFKRKMVGLVQIVSLFSHNNRTQVHPTRLNSERFSTQHIVKLWYLQPQDVMMVTKLEGFKR